MPAIDMESLDFINAGFNGTNKKSE